MRQVSVLYSLTVVILAFYLLVPSYTDAFDINSTVTNEGDLSVKMNVAASPLPADGGNRQLNRYRFDLNSRDGTESVTNTYIPETGETGAGIGFSANPDPLLLPGKLSADEQIGVDSSTSGACCFGSAGSTFGVEELTSDSTGNFNDSTYAITASGRTARLGGQFGIDVAQKTLTPDPSVYEDNRYRLRGDGEFSISGEYGFGCGELAATAEPDPFAGFGGLCDHGGGSGEYG